MNVHAAEDNAQNNNITRAFLRTARALTSRRAHEANAERRNNERKGVHCSLSSSWVARVPATTTREKDGGIRSGWHDAQTVQFGWEPTPLPPGIYCMYVAG